MVINHLRPSWDDPPPGQHFVPALVSCKKPQLDLPGSAFPFFYSTFTSFSTGTPPEFSTRKVGRSLVRSVGKKYRFLFSPINHGEHVENYPLNERKRSDWRYSHFPLFTMIMGGRVHRGVVGILEGFGGFFSRRFFVLVGWEKRAGTGKLCSLEALLDILMSFRIWGEKISPP